MIESSNDQLELSDDKHEALARISEWLTGKTQPQQFSLGGYAGTGKTTVIRELIGSGQLADLDWVALTPTGKAAHVLRSKGVPAQTIHSHLYHPKELADGTIHFEPRPRAETERDLIIVDEASMVNEGLMRDLLEITPKILWVGDHGQLEPIGDHPHIMDDPDIRLETIHRQAKGDPIIALAQWVRLGGIPKRLNFRKKDGVSVEPRGHRDFEPTINTIHITAYHKERVSINRMMRAKQGFRASTLEVGEPIICLRNDNARGIYNGMTAVVRAIVRSTGVKIVADIETDDGTTLYEIPMYAPQFGETTNGPRGRLNGGVTIWDYAYAINCHKAQGSEWDHVIVHDPGSFPKSWQQSRWRYTAVTRASKSLTYLH